MRIALCFSGQLRNVQPTYEQWWKPNVLDVNQHHQIDVFGHSWFDKTTVGSVYYAANREPTAFTANAPIPPNIIEQVYEMYNPVRLMLEHQITFDERNYNERKLADAVPQNGISRLYSIYQAVELKRKYELAHKFRYDVVVCGRYDFTIKAPMLFDNITLDGVYHLGHSPHGFNVCHAMGNSKSMDVYANLLFNYDVVFRSGVTWADELITLEYLRGIGMPIHDLAIPNGLNRG